MATYVLPQVLVFQDFNIQPATDIRDLNAFICGPNAELYRYSKSDEKALVGLGTYDHASDASYSWPQKTASSIIDTEYTNLYIDNALLRYWRDTSQTAIRTGSNKIRFPAHNLIENPSDPTTYPRNAVFYDRDVTVGDIVRVTGYEAGSGGTPIHLCSYVKKIEADQVASSIAAAVSDTNNPDTQSHSVVDSASASNSAGAPAITATAGATWSALELGLLSETYTVRVIQASTGGDHTTARFQVTSASGLDDTPSLTPAAATTPTTISSLGDVGLTVTWGAGDFAVGDTYTITVNREWLAPVAISGGTYTGTSDRKYIITVTKGGDYNVPPEITVTTQDGTDFSGPHKVYDIYGSGTSTSSTSSTSTTPAPSACQTLAVSIGQYGVTACFTGWGLRLGDRFTIDATAAKNGDYKILVLGHDLDDLIPLNDAANADFDVAFYIKKNIEVGEEHIVPGQYNWTQTNTQFTSKSGIQAYDSTYTDGGSLVALDVIKDDQCPNTNQMYVEYRAWLQTLINSVEGIRDVADLDDAVDGPTHPDNPLKYALFKALSNNNNVEVKYMAVSNPNLSASWSAVIDKIEDRDDVYGLVPLTKNRTFLNLFQAHVQSSSTATAGRWRVLWVNLENDSTVVVADATTEGETVLVTTADDPDTSGTQYTIFNGTAGKGFFANARVGDTIRYQYTVDAWGTTSYSSYVIAELLTDDSVRCETGTSIEENIPIKAEVWRDLNETEQSQALAVDGGSWNDTRVRCVWPDTIGSAGLTVEGYHLCAALAALVSGVVPHQGLTNLEISGFDDVPQTTRKFNRTQLDTMAVAGIWIVTQDLQDGEVFTRHAVTTGDYEDINQREEMVIRNVDSISFKFLDTFAPYIGISNVTPSMLDIIEGETYSCIQFLRTANATQKLGGQLIDAEITDLRAHATLKDRIVLGLSLTIPYALNNLEVHLVI